MSPDDIFLMLEQKLRARRAELAAALSPDKTELQLVDAAIARLESGDYGACCGCLEPLELSHLQRDPAMQFCAPCAEACMGTL